MTVYLVFIALIWILYMIRGRYQIARSDYLSNEKLHKKTYWGIVILCAYAIVLAVCRAETVGLDTSGYADIFRYRDFAGNFRLQGLFGVTEFGYALLQLFLRSIGCEFPAILLVEALIYIVPVGYVIYKYSKNPYLSFFLFIGLEYYLFSLSAIRQSMAIGICMIAFEMAQRKKPIWFISLVMIAFTFHITALVFLPVYILAKIPIRRKYTVLALTAGVVIYIFRLPIQGFIRQFARINYGNMATGGTGFYLFMLSIVVLDIFILKEDKESEKNVFRYMVLAAIIVYPVLQFHPSAFRLHYYYSIMLIIYLPNVMKRIKNIYVRLLLEYGYLFIVMYYMLNYPLKTLGVVPYKFAWPILF